MHRMQGLAAVVVCSLTLGAPAARAESFDNFVGRVESRLGIHRQRIPGMGFLVNAVVSVKKPAGAGSLKVAIFDEDSGMSGVRSEAFQAAVKRELGSDWKPFVEVRSKRNGEAVTAFVRLSNSSCEMVVATSEHEEGTIVQMRLDGKKLIEWLADTTSGERHGHVDIQ